MPNLQYTDVQKRSTVL